MGLFIEDLLNFGNLIDAEIEIRLSPSELKKAYPNFDFEIRDGILSIKLKKKVLFLERVKEVRLSGTDPTVRKEGERQWIFLIRLSQVFEELLRDGFLLEGERLGIDIMPAVVHTETYQKIPKQFRDKLLINRCRVGKEDLSVFFKFEK
ncbi:MAG: hypothetical protein ACK4ZR_02340 [Aquificaceae bacterium]